MRNFCAAPIRDKLMIMIRLFLFFVLFVASVPAQAQNFTSELSERDYTNVISKALRGNEATDFSYLRSLYTQMIFYQPESDLLMKELLTHSARVQMAASKAPEKSERADYQSALDTYTGFIAMHVGHPDVMWMASILAKDDPSLGDPEIYAWIYDSLKDLVLTFGDGQTPESAYEIATWGEETLIFGALGVQRLKTEPINAGFMRYNMHSVYDREKLKNSAKKGHLDCFYHENSADRLYW